MRIVESEGLCISASFTGINTETDMSESCAFTNKAMDTTHTETAHMVYKYFQLLCCRVYINKKSGGGKFGAWPFSSLWFVDMWEPISTGARHQIKRGFIDKAR